VRKRDDLIYGRDFARRHPVLNGPMCVQIAKHLINDPRLNTVIPILTALRNGTDLTPHLSPMKAAKRAFRRAAASGTWSAYVRLIDLILNKWGIHHFHASDGGLLVFTHLDRDSAIARVIDLIPHDGDWTLERRLISIVVNNWPGAGIVEAVGEGQSGLTEADLLETRTRGVNVSVEVSGTFYMPSNRALMTDGSGYDFSDNMPIICTGKRIKPSECKPTSRHPQMLMVGIDPGNPTSPWEAAAAEMGRLLSKQRAARQRLINIHRDALIRDCVKSVVRKRK